MAAGLSLYRTGTAIGGALAERLLRPFGSAEGALRGGFQAAPPESKVAAGSIWVHGASIGEVGMARTWIDALIGKGERPPLYLTTRTPAGLAWARAELRGRAAASFAPHDFPRTVAARFDAASPRRLDLIETELWPNLMLEARRRGLPVVLVSATVSARTADRLRTFGFAGQSLFGSGVYALPQSQTYAERFLGLGVAPSRIRVIGDLKARAAVRKGEHAARFGSRPALVFGSLRPGEEGTARRLAERLESLRDRAGAMGAPREARRSIAPDFEGRSRALLVVAPRHREGELGVKATFRSTPFELVVRDDGSREHQSVGAWIDDVSRRPGPRVAVLATKGELAAAYEHAWGAVVGGTFSRFGGHNVWEPAARGCPVLVGPFHDHVAAAVEAVVQAGGGAVARDGAEQAAVLVEEWMSDPRLEQLGRLAEGAVSGAAGAAERGLRALEEWGVSR